MLSKIKTYLISFLSFVFLVLFGWVKYLSSKNERLESELKIEKQNATVKDAVVKTEKKIQQAITEVQKESQKVHDENTKKRINKAKPNIGDSFSDKRL